MAKKPKESDRPTEPHATVSWWLTEIGEARKRENKYRQNAERILAIYDGTKRESTPFNILFSNTETLLPAIYSQTPRPVVERRFKDDDPIGKAASDAGTRMLAFLVDTNLQDYDPFDSIMKHDVLDALLPGRGTSVVKYDADITNAPPADGDEQTGDASGDVPVINYETVCLESKQWSRVYLGYAKKWSKVPWMAFEEYVDLQEATRLFGKSIAAKINYTASEPEDGDDRKTRTSEDSHQGEVKTARIYQIWDKQHDKQVIYISSAYPDGVLKQENDPLQLSGFYPCPKPLQFIEKTHTLLPTALYTIYENQATELNIIQARIDNLIRACKARGIYDGSLGTDIQKLMEADENELIPADSASSLASEKGLQNAIWFMPLETIQATLQQLYAARESCKQVIYEITGISDILRGASQASETATAQNIKNQWGTLRLKRYQSMVANYARDLLRIMLELAASKLSEETWAKMTGLPFLTSQQGQQVQQLATIAQQTGQPLDKQTQAKLQAPVWGQILDVLRDDLERAYRIDIETNSTMAPNATEDQKNISDLMMALAQYLQGVGPLIAQGIMPFGAAQSMMLAIARRFQFGSEVEGYIKAMTPPPPPGQEDGKAQAAQLQAQQQQAMGQLQLKQQQDEMNLQTQTMTAQKDLLAKKVELELREIQLNADSEKFALQQQVAQEKLSMQSQVHAVKTSATDQVRSLKDASQKKAQQTDTQTGSTLQKMAQQMEQIQGELQAAIMAQGEQTNQAMEQMTAAMKAPRIKRAIRGKDGRIEAMEESVA